MFQEVTKLEIPTNPGGALRPEHVLGRNELIQRYWTALETQSIALLAPRRVGKTSITKRMIAYRPEGWIVHSRDLENLDSLEGFVRTLFEDVEEHVSNSTRVTTHARKLLDGLGITQLRDFHFKPQSLDWRRLLDHVFKDLDELALQRDEKFVLFWDEFTYFLSELANEGREREAMDLLDALRAARQRYLHVRMVLTGSIGLPEVERRLRAAGHNNRALNDVAAHIVPLFDEANARIVIGALFRGAKLPASAALSDAIYRASEGHPMLIQLLIERLKRSERPSPEAVDTIFTELIEPPGDPLDLRHYIDRLPANFPAEQLEPVYAVLDHVALHPEQTPTAMLSALDLDRTALTNLLRHLTDDFYLVKVRESRGYRFRFGFLRRFWIEERGL